MPKLINLILPAILSESIVILSLLLGKISNTKTSLIALLLLGSSLSDLLVLNKYGYNSRLVYNLFIPIEIILILLVYYIESNISRQIKLIVLVLFTVYSTFNLFLIEDLKKNLAADTFCLGAVFVLGFSYLNIRDFIESDKIDFRQGFFWFSVSNLIYFSLSVPCICAIAWNWQIEELGDKTSGLFTAINRYLYFTWIFLNGIGLLCNRKTIISR